MAESRRRRLLGPAAVALHRVALAAVAGLPHGRPPPGAPGEPLPVRLLLANAWGMGGTVATTLALAGRLAVRRDVEVVSVLRRRERPRLRFPPDVRVRALDDRRGPQRLARLLGRLPSVLVHPDDYAHAWCTLWTDVVLVRWLRGLGPCAVVGTRPALDLMLARLAPPWVVTIGSEHMHARAHRPRLAADVRRTYPRLDVLTVLTTADERDYARMLAGARTRLVRIPNPAPPAGSARADPDAPVIVAAGRLTAQKGFDLLIDAFAPVAERHPGWELRIYGAGSQRDALAARVAACGLEGRVQLPGRTDRLPAALSAASVYALSSRFEGFPMVLLEAMSAGLAIAAFDCPNGPAEALEPGVDGLLVPPEDVPALSAALLALVEDPLLRHRLGAAARVSARRYDAAEIGARWEALLDELAADPPR